MAPARTDFPARKGGFAAACTGLLATLTILAVGVGAFAEPTAAATPEEKQAAARERIQRTSEAIQAGQSRLESASTEAEAAASRETALSTLLANGESRAAELGAKLEEAGEGLAASKQRLRRARAALAERLVAIYISGGTPSSTEVALDASFDQLTSGNAYLTALQDSDERLTRRVVELRAELERRVAGLGEVRDEVEAHNAALASARDRISAVRAEAEAGAAALASANAEREAEIASLRSDISEWEKQVVKERQVPPEEAEEEVEQDLGGPYSIPTYIVMCESGGDYSALNPSSMAGGAYQIIPSTWAAYGGSGTYAHEAPKAEQDRVAALIWADVGASAWSCA